MKRLLFIFFLIISINSLLAQYPISQRIGSDSTLLRSYGATQSRFVNINYADTSAANLEQISKYPGAMIYTIDEKIWIRNQTINAWIQVGGGSGSTPTFQQVLTAGSTLTGTNTISFGSSTMVLPASTGSIMLNSNNGSASAITVGLDQSVETLRLQNVNTTSLIQSGIYIYKDSIFMYPYLGKLNIDSLRKGYIDTSKFKPTAWSETTGEFVVMNSWAQVSGGSGSSYTFSNSVNNSGGTVTLLNDESSDTSKVYGFDSFGNRAFHKFFPFDVTGVTDGQLVAVDISGTDTTFVPTSISVSPGGDAHDVQLNRAGSFYGSDSLAFWTSALRVTGSIYNNGYIGLYMHPTMTQTVMVGTNSLGSFSNSGGGSNGYYNTGVGYFALNGNTTGYGNTAVGRYAMGNATVTGTNNTAVGSGALYANTGGTSNTAVGDNALFSNQTGIQNTAIGRTALNSNTGNGNVGIGFQSVYSNTSGANNTGFGTNALYYNQTGSRNVAIGYVALQGASTNSFSNATAVGYAAGLGNTTGNAGIFVGDSAGYNNTTGIRNIVIGTNLSASSATASYEMNIGGLLFGTGMTATGTSTAGSLGVGVAASSITARLHLPASTTSASSASLKINEGTRMSTAEDGAIEKDDAFYATKTNAVRYGIGGSLNTNYTTVGNVGAGEDDLQTYTIPAGTLSQDGDYIEFTMSFSVAVNSTLKVYFGATQLFSFSALATDAVYRVTGQVVRTGAATQKATFIMNGGAVQTVVGYQTPTETLSGTVVLKATGEGASNNDITQTLTMVKFFPAN